MKKEYVEQFFKDGTIRLSSFRKFSEHPDEPRRDDWEGKVASAAKGPFGTIISFSILGRNAYVLCGSTSCASSVREQFPDSDAAIVIHNPTSFAIEVAKQIPHFTGGMEGDCIYRSDRFISRLFEDPLPTDTVKNAKDLSDEERRRLAEAHIRDIEVEAMLIKEEKYSSQLEYRFLWNCSQSKDQLFVTAPFARQYCTPLDFSDIGR